MDLEDKLLGEKKHYYCSSESESSEDEDDVEKIKERRTNLVDKQGEAESSFHSCSASANTGPKGVIEDWRKFKQLENEKKQKREIEKLELVKKLSLTCTSTKEVSSEEDDVDKELLDDSVIFREYIKKRMAEVYHNTSTLISFGHVFNLKNGQEFLDAVDDAPKDVTVVIHLYEDDIPSCEAMNGCLKCLAQDYLEVKFCSLKASSARVSSHFQSAGCPALLIYKNGQIIGNFVRLEDEFGEDFFANDVENFLIQHGMLTDKTLVPPVIRQDNYFNHKDDL